MAVVYSDLDDYLDFREKLVEAMKSLDTAAWQKIVSHYRIAPRLSEQLVGDGDVTIQQLERKARIFVRQTEESDEIIPMSNIEALSYVTNFLSAEIQNEFKTVCKKFRERAEKRQLLKVVDLGLQRNPDLLKSIAFAFMTTDLFSSDTHAEFKALAEEFKVREQIETIKSFEKEKQPKKLSLLKIDEAYMHPSEGSYELIRKHQKPIFEAKFYYDREDSWVIGYYFEEYADGTPIKEGDKTTLEEAEKVLKYKMKRSAFTVNCLTHPAKLTQNQFDALCSFNLNVGVDNFAKSTLLKLLKVDPDNPSIATEFRKWIYRRKEPAPGQERKHVIEDELKIRREDELKLYFKDD